MASTRNRKAPKAAPSSPTGTLIWARREKLKLSRLQLAQRLGMTRMTVYRVEHGEQQVASDDLPKWAAALETKPAKLVPDVAAAA